MKRPRSSTRNDLDRVKDAAQELRAEVRKLRKDNSSLRKQLNRTGTDRSVAVEDGGEDQDHTPQEVNKEVCPKCKSQNFKRLKAGIFSIAVCDDCGFKKRTQAKNRSST